ncbi:MAG: hypothetical protein AAGC95_05475 [Pseudomonadota bacterium]
MLEPVSVDLTPDFNKTRPVSKKRLPPFSLRLSQEERTYLEAKAGKAALGAYIKSKIFTEDDAPGRSRRKGISVEDEKAFARVLGLLGQSRYSNNLSQLAQSANIGALDVSPELEQELIEACAHVTEIKALLMKALGLKEPLQ